MDEVEVIKGVVTHKKDCPGCNGEGKLRIPCNHAPDCCERIEVCEECKGEEILYDETCDCGVCVQVQEDMDAAWERAKKHADWSKAESELFERMNEERHG